jgi:hypothetical protein
MKASAVVAALVAVAVLFVMAPTVSAALHSLDKVSLAIADATNRVSAR